MKKHINKIIAIFIAMLMMVNVAPKMLYAEEKVDTNQKCTLEIKYEAIDAQLRLYRIAEIDEDASFTLTEAYQDYRVALDDDAEAAALALESYINRDQKVPEAYAQTDENGVVRFENLETGIYLLLSNRVEKDELYYEPLPVMVSLPSKTVEMSEYQYDVVVNMKYTKVEIEDLPETINLKVMKSWEGGSSNTQPKSIVATLLKDGFEHDKVELNQANNWQHEWKDLSSKFVWDVIEDKVPEHYTLKKNKNNLTIILTNTYDDSDDDSGNKKPPKAPDSGQLWWPIPLLVVGGLSFVVLGFILRKKEDINEA